MIKLVHLLRRREGVSRERFQHWWRTSHAPLMRRQQPVRRKARYVQLHSLEPPQGSEWLQHSAYEGVSESWFQDLGEKRRLDALPAGIEARVDGRADHGPYIHPETSSLQIETVEHLVLGPDGRDGPDGSAASPPRLVVVDCLVAAPGLSRSEVAAWWREEHAALVAELGEQPGFLAYTQSLVDAAWAARVVADGAPEPCIGFAETTWESAEALARAQSAPQSRLAFEAICAGLERHRDRARSLRFLTEQHVVIDAPRA